ncbi:UDP-N-acetylmuramoyl-L-alanine--D-glutamate ligase [Patescibacteria group bacterium]|nr:UDP-N-acetylmuramoyl-L-alanine--D-glutamate ligase [Patescibacteria group bacterium]MBU1682332.1 UDP-N-acetylmuramoyl-L-alanine--D-glutamate ligase [Patescibacteria group bacterium]MBU1935540.1 UDP-N-acetylmuramoyl-L-alanine--D-glutamate ligase [Patescibacteria group bacterium]
MNIKPPVAILGYGVEGKAAFAFLQNKGIKSVTVFDENMKSENRSRSDVEFRSEFKNLTDFNTVIRSPGVHYDRPEIREALDAGVNVTSMTELTLEIAKERITAITGSNGKTTTTALAADILAQHYGDELIVGGNDREPTLQRAISNPEHQILMEVSSFQFADIHMSPHISAVLNITPNHMDWHEDLQDYINAKNNLILHQEKDDWAILNANNENSTNLAKGAPGQIFWIGQKKGKRWAIWKGDNLVINKETIINKKDIKVKTHPDTIAFAAAIGKIHEIPNEKIAKAIKKFKGVVHRLEFVRKINGVSFYNDSCCTTPESSEVAIDQFEGEKFILMLGGSSKHSDFSFLAAKIKNHNVRVYLYGKEGKRIKEAIKEAGAEDLILRYNENKDFAEIIEDVFVTHSKKGDSIVLSPACASFDMFENAKQRGYQFKEIVENL